jgi:arylsulfatase A-like enzyme
VRVSELVDLLDVAPTVADVFGLRDDEGVEREFQGRSLLPVAAGGTGKPLVVSRTVWDRPRYALRDGRFTYLYDAANGQERLFDTSDDPGEKRNVAAAQALRTAWFRQTLHQWMRTVFRPGSAPLEGLPTMSRAQCEQLKVLGYLGADHRCPPQ